MTPADDPRISEECLNAYLDGELAAPERERVAARLADDADLARRLAELHALQTRMRAAYADLPPAARSRPLPGWPWSRALAAGLLLVLGAGLGWVAREQYPPAGGTLATLAQPLRLPAATATSRLVLHLDAADAPRMRRLLDLAENWLGERGAEARVEVVVNSYGIDLLRADANPYRARIGQLAADRRLAFVACGQTLARLAREGERVVLLPEARVGTSAISEIVARLREGWGYVKV